MQQRQDLQMQPTAFIVLKYLGPFATLTLVKGSRLKLTSASSPSFEMESCAEKVGNQALAGESGFSIQQKWFCEFKTIEPPDLA